MRAFTIIIFCCLALVCQAQVQEAVVESRLRNLDKESTANANNGMASPLNGKKFGGTPDLKIKNSTAGTTSFANGSKKFGSDAYTTRSFFGLKNPWFGKKVVKTDEALLWSKSLVANGDKKFATDTALTREFYQADKTGYDASRMVEKRQFIPPEGKAQGMLDKAKPKLTIDEVREILNKNR